MKLHNNVHETDVSEERIASIFRAENSASDDGCSHLLTLVPRSQIFLL
jgi:hypothetical protein